MRSIVSGRSQNQLSENKFNKVDYFNKKKSLIVSKHILKDKLEKATTFCLPTYPDEILSVYCIQSWDEIEELSSKIHDKEIALKQYVYTNTNLGNTESK
jgi:hypothetical protein